MKTNPLRMLRTITPATALAVAICAPMTGCSTSEENPKNVEMAWIDEKAIATQGDLSKLSPTDREKLDRLSAGHPAEALQMKWQAYQLGQARKAEAAKTRR